MNDRTDDIYEAPEKKLEIILDSKTSDLRGIPRRHWDQVAQAGRAKILSHISTHLLDAYLLSESSLFIWQDRLVMMTCGDASPLKAIPEILDIVDEKRVARVMYSRKNNNRPNENVCVAGDLKRLETFFPGKHYCLGSPDLDHVHFFCSENRCIRRGRPDVVFQMFMHELGLSFPADIDDVHPLAQLPELLTPIFEKVIPGVITDSHMFTPAGFSLNGISMDHYVTVHITPDPECSYMSFETNVQREDYSDIVNDITSCIRPGRFSVVFSSSAHGKSQPRDTLFFHPLHSYAEQEKQHYQLDHGCRVSFASYTKNSAVKIVEKTARKLFEHANGSHDWEHTLRVFRLCDKIGTVEGADMDVVAIAAYLHDIGRCHQDASNGKICHAEKGAEMAAGIIGELELSGEQKQNILHCIQSHRFRGRTMPETKEAKVLFDADKLDAIGAVGVARAYLFAGELGARFHNEDNNIENTTSYSREDTGYREFMVKLRKVKDRILTEEGRRMAEDRHDFMTQFFARFLEEQNGER